MVKVFAKQNASTANEKARIGVQVNLSFTKFVQNVFEYEKTAFAEKIEDIYEAALIWVSDINDPAEK